MKILNIISCAYRATVEEQDDTIVWLTHAMRRAGADIDVLLRASACNYVVEGPQVTPFAIAGRAQRNAPDVHGAVRDLAHGGAAIFVLEEDLGRYGLSNCPMLPQARRLGSGALPQLLSGYDSVWHW